MKISIYGIEKKLTICEGEIGLLNIHNKSLYNSIVSCLLYELDISENNEIVFIEDDNRLNMNNTEYIQDLHLYSFNSKQIIDKLLKDFKTIVNEDIQLKNKETSLYIELLKPFLKELNLLEIDYEYKEEMDQSFYSKIPNISFKLNDLLPPSDKILSIINLNIKVFNKKIFVFNSVIGLLTNEELYKIKDFVSKTDSMLLFVDYLDNADVVIKNNLCIDSEYGVYEIGDGII